MISGKLCPAILGNLMLLGEGKKSPPLPPPEVKGPSWAKSYGWKKNYCYA